MDSPPFYINVLTITLTLKYQVPLSNIFAPVVFSDTLVDSTIFWAEIRDFQNGVVDLNFCGE